MSKYFSKKVEACGLIFDSKREAERWNELLRLRESGEIKNLERQVKFELIPKQVDADGKCIERALTYIADFVYTTKEGAQVVEDVKPKGKDGKVPKFYKTTPAWKDYVIKRKLMLYLKGIKIREV